MYKLILGLCIRLYNFNIFAHILVNCRFMLLDYVLDYIT